LHISPERGDLVRFGGVVALLPRFVSKLGDGLLEIGDTILGLSKLMLQRLATR